MAWSDAARKAALEARQLHAKEPRTRINAKRGLEGLPPIPVSRVRTKKKQLSNYQKAVNRRKNGGYW